jgi:hypothetical protein
MKAQFVCASVQMVGKGKGCLVDLNLQGTPELKDAYTGGICMIFKPEHVHRFIIGQAYRVTFEKMP